MSIYIRWFHTKIHIDDLLGRGIGLCPNLSKIRILLPLLKLH